MESKIFAIKTQTFLKELGYDVKLGHCYELLSKLSGYKSWNVAKVADGFKPLLNELEVDDSIKLAINARNKIKDLVDNGLPSSYTSIDSFFYDWYPSLPWDDNGRNKATDYLLKDSEFVSLAKIIKEKFNYDLIHWDENIHPALKVVTKQVGDWVRWDYGKHVNSFYLKTTVKELDKYLENGNSDNFPFKSAIIDHNIVCLFEPYSDSSNESVNLDDEGKSIEEFFLGN